jgi:hypothetical protein
METGFEGTYNGKIMGKTLSVDILFAPALDKPARRLILPSSPLG